MNRSIAIILLAGAAGSVNAGFVSFASDGNGDGPTFVGTTANSFRDGDPLSIDGIANVQLLIDLDRDGPLPATVRLARLRFDGVLSNYAAVPVGTLTAHTYRLSAQFSFLDQSTGSTILSVISPDAVFSSFSNSGSAWGPAGGIQSVNASIIGGELASLFTEAEDFAFTLTSLQDTSGGAVNITPNGAIQDVWRSEASFSASLIPSPGAMVLLGAGLVTATRRRR